MPKPKAVATRTVTYTATAEPKSWAAVRGVEVDRVPDDLAAYLTEATGSLGLPPGVEADIVATPGGPLRRMPQRTYDEVAAEIERLDVHRQGDSSAEDMWEALRWVVGLSDVRPSDGWEE